MFWQGLGHRRAKFLKNFGPIFFKKIVSAPESDPFDQLSQFLCPENQMRIAIKEHINNNCQDNEKA